MPYRSLDFQRIYRMFQNYYHDPIEADHEYYEWVNHLAVDETKPYAACKESFIWAQDMISAFKEDADNKYYKVLLAFPVESMNHNVYSESDLKQSAESVADKHPSYLHKDRYWFKPGNPWGTLSTIGGRYEDGAVETILKVPKSAVCPTNPHEKIFDMIDKKKIYNVSLEGNYNEKGIFEFGNPPFTLLPVETLPGIPLARIKPIEAFLPFSQSSIIQEANNKVMENKKVKVKPKIIESVTPNTSTMNPPQPNVNTGSLATADFKGTTPAGMITQDKQIEDQNDQARTVLGTPAFTDNTNLKTPPLTQSTPHHVGTQTEKKVGEPFAGYTDFDDCVAQNSDKEDPAAYCASIKNQTEAKEENSAPTFNTNGAPSGGQPAPEYVPVEGGPTRNKPPQFSTPDAGSLPSAADHAVVMGNSPGSIGVKVGTAPVESLPTLEERRAKVNAELKAANAEERAIKWEEEYNKLYTPYQQLIGKSAQQAVTIEQLQKAKDEAVRETHNKEVERDGWHSKYEHELALREEYKKQVELLQQENSRITENYQKTLSTNLELSKKLTVANEEYLDIAHKLESANDALEHKDVLLKKTIRIKA